MANQIYSTKDVTSIALNKLGVTWNGKNPHALTKMMHVIMCLIRRFNGTQAKKIPHALMKMYLIGWYWHGNCHRYRCWWRWRWKRKQCQQILIKHLSWYGSKGHQESFLEAKIVEAMNKAFITWKMVKHDTLQRHI